MTGTPEDYTDGLEVALAIKADLGEGPIWDAAANRLIFVDCNRGSIHCFDPIHDQVSTIEVGKTIGVAIPRSRGGFVASTADGLLAVSDERADTSLLVPIESDLPKNRMNDGKCDSRGRLWSGTFSTLFERGAGSLYRIDPDLSLSRAVDRIRVSNGIAWSPDERLLYFNDTLSGGIDVFNYDIDTGSVSHRRRLVEIDRAAGLPDGMAVDAQGCIWVALFLRGQVRRYSPKGALIGVISLPVARVTSCNFGGSDLGDLYITTADLNLHDDGRPHEPEAGFLFRCRPGVKGMPSYAFAG
jgi:sugar lactone lactonase YvrE